MTDQTDVRRRRVVRAAAGSAAFLALAPGVMGGLIPWALTGWHAHAVWPAARVLGAVLIACGAGALIHAFARFVLEGIGTPAPAYPTERLVVGGLYRYVRNPMYIAVATTILGQALLLGQAILVGYAAAFALTVATFVYGYEQPTLEEQFGDEYAAYRAAVPAWRPRLRPWNGATPDRAQPRA
jgi:protein-S-isoprenylcysteine O-methyltransferase Ste14